jgi:hypothetical protein
MSNLTDVAGRRDEERRFAVKRELADQVFEVAVHTTDGLHSKHFAIV